MKKKPSIADLITTERKVEIGGVSFKLRPYTLGVMAEITKHFEAQGKDGLFYVESILSGKGSLAEMLQVVSETIYFLLDNPNLTLEEFCKLISNKEKQFDKLANILLDAMAEDAPIYNLDKKKAKMSSVLLGWLMIILSTVGLIHTIYWLVTMAINYKIF